MAFPDELKANLSAEHFAKLHYLEETDSTNNQLKALARDKASDETFLIADHQTSGRGRLGRTFLSPAGTGLYLSYLHRRNKSPDKLLNITGLTAVAVCKALQSFGITPEIKWVNDILLGGKKVCGILTESLWNAGTNTVDGVIIGIGINVTTPLDALPAELSAIAGSIQSVTGMTVSRAALAEHIVTELEKTFSEAETDFMCYVNYYRSRCVTIGQEILILNGNGSKLAYAKDIDGNFGLMAEYPNGDRDTIASGEVSIRQKDSKY